MPIIKKETTNSLYIKCFFGYIDIHYYFIWHMNMLDIQQLTATINEKKVLKEISLQCEKGKNYCILGKNWSGKSSLALTVMWHPSYEIQEGKILIDGNDITEMEPNERAEKWIFLAFQNIPEIKGVKLFEFLRTIYNTKHNKKESFVTFKKIILPYLRELSIDKEFLRRDLNVWFSWWERRKIEILQLKLLEPSYIFLDEVDSWLDVDAFKAVAELMKDIDTENNTFIIITHYFTILDYIPVDHVIVLENGQIKEQGDQTLANIIKTKWFWS